MNTTAPAEGLGRRRPGPGPQCQVVHNSRPLMEGFAMSRMSLLSSPLLLGFEEMERLIDRVGKGDGYPPYNIERIAGNGAGNGECGAGTDGSPAHYAGGCGLQARPAGDHGGGQPARHSRPPGRGQAREFIHRGIAARQFSRSFVLAEGIEVKTAELSDGLLCIDLVRREPDRRRAQGRDRRHRNLSRSGHSAEARIAGR